MTKDRQLGFAIDDELFGRLEAARWEAHASRSEYIRRAIEEKVEREEGGA